MDKRTFIKLCSAFIAGRMVVSLFTDWQKQGVNEVWIKIRADANFEAHPDPDLVCQIEALEKPIGKGLYRGLLKTVCTRVEARSDQ